MTRHSIIKYLTILLIGTLWFLVAGFFGRGVPIFGKNGTGHFICALLTSYITMEVFLKPIMTWKYNKWLLIPLATIAFSSFLFGFLLPFSWLLASGSGEGVDGGAFISIPFTLLFYSMSYFLIPLYILALITQFLLKLVFKNFNSKVLD